MVTFTTPLLPIPGVAVICVGELMVNDAAATPPNDTALASLKFVPVITILLLLLPVVGVNSVTEGALFIVAVTGVLVTDTVPATFLASA